MEIERYGTKVTGRKIYRKVMQTAKDLEGLCTLHNEDDDSKRAHKITVLLIFKLIFKNKIFCLR